MPIATNAPGGRTGIPANPTHIGAMRTSFANGRQPTLSMLSSSPDVLDVSRRAAAARAGLAAAAAAEASAARAAARVRCPARVLARRTRRLATAADVGGDPAGAAASRTRMMCLPLNIPIAS
jgi:hypothetical protein